MALFSIPLLSLITKIKDLLKFHLHMCIASKTCNWFDLKTSQLSVQVPLLAFPQIDIPWFNFKDVEFLCFLENPGAYLVTDVVSVPLLLKVRSFTSSPPPPSSQKTKTISWNNQFSVGDQGVVALALSYSYLIRLCNCGVKERRKKSLSLNRCHPPLSRT